MLAKRPGIADVQRFGDRLDVMVRDVGEGERAVREALGAAGLAVSEVRAAAPTLENAFVSILRELEGDAPVPDFPREPRSGPLRRRRGDRRPGPCERASVTSRP